MKRHIFNTFILGFAIASCTDPFMGQTATDHVAPGPIKNAKVINLEGSALITYDGQSIGIYRSLILSDDVFVSLVSRFDIE